MVRAEINSREESDNARVATHHGREWHALRGLTTSLQVKIYSCL